MQEFENRKEEAEIINPYKYDNFDVISEYIIADDKLLIKESLLNHNQLSSKPLVRRAFSEKDIYS